MKFRKVVEGESVVAVMSGDLEVDSCTCLTNFWNLDLAGHPHIDVCLADVDALDGKAMATLVALIHDALLDGSRVTLRQAPQIVAHNLYRLDLLRHAGLVLIETRVEEPYGS